MTEGGVPERTPATRGWEGVSWLSSVQSHSVYLDPEDPGKQGCP